MELVGYVGFQLSYGAKWFGGYRRDSIGKRNYSLEAYNNIVKDISLLKNIDFYNLTYNELIIPENSIIYCDPPYKNTTKYTATNTSVNMKHQMILSVFGKNKLTTLLIKTLVKKKELKNYLLFNNSCNLESLTMYSYFSMWLFEIYSKIISFVIFLYLNIFFGFFNIL